MAKDYSQVNFRIPTKLKEQIEQSAVANERSLTAELVARLEESFRIEIGLKDGVLISETGMKMIESTMYNMMANIITSLKEQGIDEDVITKAVQTNME